MSDSHALAEAQLVDDVRDIVGVGRDRVRAVRLVALAMPAQVNGHDPMPPREMVDLRGEERAVASPAVYEDKGGSSRAAILKGQLDAVAYNRCHTASPPFSDPSEIDSDPNSTLRRPPFETPPAAPQDRAAISKDALRRSSPLGILAQPLCSSALHLGIA